MQGCDQDLQLIFFRLEFPQRNPVCLALFDEIFEKTPIRIIAILFIPERIRIPAGDSIVTVHIVGDRPTNQATFNHHGQFIVETKKIEFLDFELRIQDYSLEKDYKIDKNKETTLFEIVKTANLSEKIMILPDFINSARVLEQKRLKAILSRITILEGKIKELLEFLSHLKTT